MSETTSVWSTGGSKAPLIFEPYAGVFMIESQFLAEMAVAFTDKQMKLKVASHMAKEQLAQNDTFAKALSHMQKAREHSGFHTIEEDLLPAFFALEHVAEHECHHALEA